jgi:VWFA-related protein
MRAFVYLVLFAAPLAHSADPPEVSIRSAAYVPPPPTITAQSNLVESGVTVYDSAGRAVGGLTVSDFVLLDNGKPQPVTAFSELRNPANPGVASRPLSGTPGMESKPIETTPARYVALYIDDIHLLRSGLPGYRAAAEKLINRLQPGERLGIFTTSGSPAVDFTTDTSALLAALPQIKPQNDPTNRAMSICPTLTPYAAFVIAEHIDEGEKEAAIAEVLGCKICGGDRLCAEGHVMDTANAIWDGARHFSVNSLDVLKLLVAHLAKQDGGRVLVMVSAGFIDDDRMKPQIKSILDAANRAHVTVNSLAVEFDQRRSGPLAMGYRQLLLINTMTDAAAATGGRVVKNTNDYDGALDALASAPEVSYLIGFQAGEPDGKYHALKLSLTGHRGLRIETRPGYFATRPTVTVQQRIDSAVRSKAVLPDFPVSVQVKPAALPGDGYKVQVTVDIDAKHLKFGAQGGLHLQQLTFVTAIEDRQGNFVTGKQAVMDLRVKPAKLASIERTGIHAVESFSLPKGAYTVREVVRELVQDRLGASNTPLDLR